jgi:hypothetical protein
VSDRSAAPLRIVSGGQTGVDRAALDAALAADILCGGWCPAGRWAEDGLIPPRFPLRETASADPAERTRLNVRDNDGTLVLCAGPLAGGTALAAEHARALGRPLLVLDPAEPGAVEAAAAWVSVRNIGTLNVAGPRESEAPRIYAAARRFVAVLIARLGHGAGDGAQSSSSSGGAGRP